MRPIPRRTILEGQRLGAAALAFGGVQTRGSAEQRVTVGLIGAGGWGATTSGSSPPGATWTSPTSATSIAIAWPRRRRSSRKARARPPRR